MADTERAAGARRIAAFDFDGTLSRRDTLVPFLASAGGRARFARVCANLGVSGARRTVDVRDRDGLKEQMIRQLFAGRSESELVSRARLYSRDLLTNQLRPEVLRRLDQHRDAGHEVVFVSASLAHYLDPLAAELGVAGVLAVELESVDGRLTGGLARPNVRAEQKAIRLREWLGQEPHGPLDGVELWAYGNSSGDHALLELADHAFWLGRPNRRPAGVAPFRPGPLAP